MNRIDPISVALGAWPRPLLAGICAVVFFLTGPISALAADGFANVNGTTTGGAGGAVVTVSTLSDFNTYADGTTPYIINVSGMINLGSSNVYIGSNKTVIGVGENSGFTGNLRMNGQTNVILQRLNFTNPGDAGSGDGLTVTNSTHLWVDHCTFFDCADGCLDIINASDFITVSWCKFYYTFDSGHNYVNLIGNSDGAVGDTGKLHITMHHNWYSTLCKARMPRVRFGQVHVYNNYYGSPDSGGCIGVGNNSQIRLENGYFEGQAKPWLNQSSSGNQGLINYSGNVFVNCSQPTWAPNSTVFTPPYSYTLDVAADVKSIVMAGAGAGQMSGPAAPDNLTATATSTSQIDLAWQDTSSDETQFRIERKEGAGSFGFLVNKSANSISHSDNPLSAGTSYTYRVRAENAAGNSAFSNEASATTDSAGSVIYQAEDGAIAGEVKIDSNNAGFNGTGYANFPLSGGTLTWSNVGGGGGGSATLRFRYALDAGSRTGDLTVNGVTQSITFNATGSWTTWATMDVSKTLNAGTTNTVQLASTGEDLANIDEMTVLTSVGNTAPVAVNDSYSTNEDVQLTVAAPGVLSNDTDAESNPLTAVLVTGPASGALTLNSNGSFTYTPNANFNANDSFTYKANDGLLDSNTATVSITVNPVNDAPVAVNDSYSTNEDVQLTVAAPGVLGNDTDAESNPLTAVLVIGPASGALTLDSNGSFTYTPNANFSGSDSFTYKANDGLLDSNTATVSITVNPVNDAPVAVNDSYSTNEDVQLTVAAPGVLGNDTDTESDPLTAALVAGPASGALTLNSNGSFTYTPNANFSGSDSFTYKANDGLLDSNTATVSITVNPAGGGGGSVIYQAEDGAIAGGVKIDSNNAGFNGTGYANFPSTGGTLTWSNVDGGGGGAATLRFRYALDAGSRTGDLTVNGVTQSITFNATGSWTTWATMDVSKTLNAGTTNTVQLASTGEDLANIDEMTVLASAANNAPEAEGASGQANFPPFTVASDAAASNGQYIVHTGASSTGAPPADGHAEFTCTLEGTVAIWIRVYFPDGQSDSFWMKYDAENFVNFFDNQNYGTWAWLKWGERTAAGNNTLTVAYREKNAQLDRVLFTTDLNFTPVGTGP